MKNDKTELWIDKETLPCYGENTARLMEFAGRGNGKKTAEKLKQTEAQLEELCKAPDLAGQAALEWLRDNRYILRRDAAGCCAQLCTAKRLRKLRDGRLLICAAMEALVLSGGGSVDEERTAAFLTGFQKACPLEERELALLPAALRFALICRLRRHPGAAEQIFGALKWLNDCRVSALVDAVSPIEPILQRDPAGIYGRMDEESRWDYRQQTASLASRYGITETEGARQVLALAQAEGCHVGEFLYRRPLGKKARNKPYTPYFALYLLLPLIPSLALAFHAAWFPAALLTLPSVHDALKFLFDRLAARFIHPRRLPRLDYSGGIPDESRTLAVSAVLLTSGEEASEAAKKLELFRLANRDAGENLSFGLLADLKEGDSRCLPGDEEILRSASEEIRRLNDTYGGGFCLLHRQREFSPRDKVWRGKERKRGAVMALTALLRGKESGLVLAAGDERSLERIRYLIVLDGDTMLNVGAASRLAGTMAHPLQKAELDADYKSVRRGYGILQPKISVSLKDAQRSEFARVFAGQGGLDPYGSLSSDVYQDIFGEGSYTGKGILDVDAFQLCLQGSFPPETLLSHDLMEGGYLGCAFLSDVELTDGFPAGVLSYFERQNRWIRGDWQTLPWLFPRVKDEAGRRQRNPLSPLSKWKILDNLIRSITPAAEFLTLILCGLNPCRARYLCLAAMLICLALRIAAAAEGHWRFTRRYRARLFSAAKSDFLQLLWLLLLLPYRAWVHGSAITLALYRSFVSRRHMLAWVTASEGDKKSCGGVFIYYRRMWPCIAAAVIGFFCPWVVLKALGVLWLITPALCRASSRSRDGKRPPSDAERLFLLHCAGDIVRYYAELVTAARHWLPPDNLQETPMTLVAERTSPTNIGLWLLSALAAADLGIWTPEQSWERIGKTLKTLHALPRCRGHFYNWYDILRCEPLQPPFISTVDSGNLLACLLVLRAAALESGKTEALGELDDLIGGMKLDFLYDGQKELLRIGWDPIRDKPAEGWYDLLESEARIASFLAVSRGEAPRRHWRRLGRTLADAFGMSGMASWTGTMFEYLMPALFMPSPEGSLLEESQEFCLHAQKKRLFHGVWGMSESAFAARDAADNYAYKAHGVQALALKHGMDREAVIAPYAAFLALEEDSHAAVKNLRRLRRLGAEGRYGFCEALDFTAERRENAPYQVVRCFMSHHLGMSLLAIDNCLKDGVMQRRFMADPANRAFRELLEEKTPVGQRIRPVRDYRADPRPEREKAEGFLMTRSGFDPRRPIIYPLAGGPYRLLLSELGYGDACVLLSDGQGGVTEIAPHNGVFFFAGTAQGVVSLQPLPELRFREEDRSCWDGSRVRQYSRGEGLSFCLESFVPESGGEVRSVTVKNGSGEKRRLTVAMYLEPVLCPRRDYASHPAFHRLCLESSMLDGALTVSRRGGGTVPPCTLAITCTEPFEAETDKERALGRGGLRAIAAAMDRVGSDVRASSDPCVFLRIRLELRPNEERTVRFALAAAPKAAAAAEAAADLLKRCGETGGSFRRAKAKLQDKLSPEEAVMLLTPLFASGRGKSRTVKDREILWRCGISGDLPVAFCRAKESERMLAAWAFLRGMGVTFDLAIDTEDEGVYGRPGASALRTQALELGLNAWEDKPGGFHFVGGNEEEISRLEAATDAVGLQTPKRTAVRGMVRESLLSAGAPNRIQRSGEFTEEGFLCRKTTGLGVRAWSLMLTNGSLGWMAADSGCGYLWLGNARERRLTPWLNDPTAIRGGEEIFLLRDGRSISLMADADEVPTELLFGFGFIRWRRWISGTEAVLTGFIPPRQDCRFLLLELHGRHPTDKLRYRILPAEPGILSVAVGERTLKKADSEEDDGSIVLEYPAQDDFTIVLWPGKGVPALQRDGTALLKETKEYWRQQLDALRVETPSPALNAYLNGWAVYQTLACRILGRSSLYQSGGAYGFRDQLQDVCALIDLMPELAKEHILRSAAHQYEEGDVMHWWHPGPEGDKGVRTRCSDDLLWLPYACTLYVGKTGDDSLWEEKAPWLRSPELRDDERDRYEAPSAAGEDTLREHCRRAVRRLVSRGTGPHGLPRMGAGDWNDGLDRVEGESVWLGWFAALVLERLGAALGNEDMRVKAGELGAAADAAWSDGHYLRGYYADGRPLGTEGDGECALDSLSQSFAVLSGFGDPVRSRAAVVKAAKLLLDRENRLVRLFTPPFNGDSDPGYIRSYLPGVRENGGQYTHGGIWLAAACLRCGETELGWELLETMLPSVRSDDVYQLEPFVIAADVYSNPDMPGRGGWSWYTGAAGWFLRTSVEELLGIRTKAGTVYVEPKLPASWDGYRLKYRAGGKDYGVKVSRSGEGWEAEIVKSEKD
ncbi:MAG: hypothetical protein IKN89_11610 [Oscillospiraceae bacterium]|nr:hypothetical protein [Oscillospiraceae bacterium]